MPENLEALLQRIGAEEKTLVFSSFTNDDALALGQLLMEKARSRALPVAIDVERCGERLFYAALPGSTPDNAGWIERKKRLVNRVHRSSFAVGLELRATNKTLEQRMLLDEKDYAPHGGCVPVVVAQVGFVGTVTVSGLPQEEDHALVVEAMREFLAGRAKG
ncbi:MAG TPA: heme-degrading domain-containing protein [Myxococcales bacterium]